MDTILLAFLGSVGLVVVLSKLIGLGLLIKTQAIWDLALTVGLPLLWTDTYSGAVLAILTGVFFTGIMIVVSMTHNPP